ncbi:sugar O-acyltransferase (sialic acid O-acetyltransferase NeuD family) [Flavobacterium arsenatis]|uniref:Sugar O-acyltransferase (Sialic acid O-acetyltransferase NeuD family) n=1 Tax=Flavobacterium arsenatis TaxID=1484332 RepID=A0ABU1TLZ8_9FLAO|nr:hypothetical protein [Flavobacterium arsenatis]MDR6966990.1 sugar O-acyltransferase (sialic acid O-acetyltransferase NeuD family) [Flavobacterium arsenatis]
MSQKNLYIFGLSTTAKSIFTFVVKYNLFNVKGFIVDKAYKENDDFCGLPIIGFSESENLESFNSSTDLIFIAIQWNKVNQDRKDVYSKFKRLGYRFANIVSPTAIIHGEINGDNCWISDYAVIDTNTIIGSNVFIKTKAFIGNDSIIEDHCFIGANSFIAGDCFVQEQTFIGICVTIFDRVKIGKKCIIGATTVINRNIPDYTLVKSTINQTLKEYDEELIEQKLTYTKNIR